MNRQLIVALTCYLMLGISHRVQAQLQVYGGPGYDADTLTGVMAATNTMGVNSSGVAVAGVYDYSSTVGKVVRFQFLNGGSILEGFGGDLWAVSPSINASNQTIATMYNIDVNPSTYRPSLWDTLTTPTELVSITALNFSRAARINNSGVIVGSCSASSGNRAVKWLASNPSPVELLPLSRGLGGLTYCAAADINNNGVAVGYSHEYNSFGQLTATTAVRWNNNLVVPVRLGTAPLVNKTSSYYAAAINDLNIAVGSVADFDLVTYRNSTQAIRWNAARQATRLDVMWTDANGVSGEYAHRINSLGESIGSGRKYSGGNDLGARGIRWAATSTAGTELAPLSTSASGTSNTYVYQIGNNGLAVGMSEKYDSSGNEVEPQVATVWMRDGTPVDLNELGLIT